MVLFDLVSGQDMSGLSDVRPLAVCTSLVLASLYDVPSQFPDCWIVEPEPCNTDARAASSRKS